MFHQERIDVAPFAAAKAVKYLLIFGDRKGWRSFGMEWANSDVVSSALLKTNILANDLHDIGILANLIDYVLRYHT